MATEAPSEVLQQLATLQRDVTELLTLVRQMETRSASQKPSTSEEEFFDAEGGE